MPIKWKNIEFLLIVTAVLLLVFLWSKGQRVEIRWEESYLPVATVYLWLPFGIFALLDYFIYWLFERSGFRFQQLLTRWHVLLIVLSSLLLVLFIQFGDQPSDTSVTDYYPIEPRSLSLFVILGAMLSFCGAQMIFLLNVGLTLINGRLPNHRF